MSQKMGSMIFLSALVAVGAVACNGSNNNSATPAPTPTSGTCSNCSSITPENFVAALVSLGQSGQIAAGYSSSTLVKAQSAQAGWFVIWDGATQSYMSVNVNDQTFANWCSQAGASCSGLNAQSAALAFAAGGNQPVYEEVSDSGTVSGSAGGTYFYGTYTGTADVARVGSYTFGQFGTWTTSPTDNSGLYQLGVVTAYSVKSTGETDSAGNTIYTDTYGEGMLYSQNQQQTHDTDLQKAQLQTGSLVQRAANVSASFQMDFTKALQLTSLADKLSAIQAGGNSLTADDRSAMMQTLSGIAGVTSDQLSQVIVEEAKGNTQPANDLVDTISKNLGMPSSSTLRDQILPKLGLSLD